MTKVVIEKDGNIYAEIFKSSYFKTDQTMFFSDPKMPLQYGVLVYKKNHHIRRHMHAEILRSSSKFCEATFVLQGEEVVSIFDEFQNIISKHILEKDDLLVVHRGFHSMDILADFRALEFKVGPFIADDKEYA